MAEQAGELQVKLTADFENLKRGLSNAQETLRQFGKQGEKVGRKISNTFKKFGENLAQARFVMAGIAGGFAAAGIASVVAAGKMEQWTVSFETMLGSAERAQRLLSDVADFAAKTPFSLPEVVKGSKSLLAFGIEGEKVIPTLKALGDVSAGLGVPMERLILNFGQVKAQAKLTGRELRDFAIAGVPLTAELAKNLNVAEKEISEMVSAGKIGFPEVEAAFKSMSGEGGRFADLMQKQSKTLFGVISNLKDNIIRLAISIGDELLPAVKFVTNWLMRLTGFVQELSPQMKRVLIIVSGLIGGLAGVASILGFIVVFKGVIIAFLSVTFGWIGVILASIGTLIAIIIALQTNFLGVRDAVINSWNAMLPVFEAIGEFLGMLIPNQIGLLWNLIKMVFEESDSLISTVVNAAWSTFLGLFQGFMKLAWKVIEFGGTLIPDTWKEAFEKIKTAGIGALGTVKTEFGSVGKGITRMVDDVKRSWGGAMGEVETAQIAAIEGMMVTVQTYQEFLTSQMDARIQAWIEAKQAQIEIDQKAKKILSIQDGAWVNQSIRIIDGIFDNFASGIADMIMEGKRFSDVMKKIWQSLAREIIKLIVKMIAKMLILHALKAALGFGTGGVSNLAPISIGALPGGATGGLIQEPSIITGLRSGKSIVAGEAGTEALIPTGGRGSKNMTAKEMGTSFEGALGGNGDMAITVNIQGQFIEGNESKWQRLIRDKIVPELRRRTMADPRGLFNRRRGATT